MSMQQSHKTEIISIIMPIYNSGDFLIEAIDSLLNQTFRDFKLICVDDGSDDIKTKKILENYSLYPQVKIVHLGEKHGAGEARNIGLRNACGEYVIFLDADDIFDKQMLEIMYRKINEESANICLCGSEWFYTDDERIEMRNIPVLPEKQTDDWLLGLSYVPWDKLVRRKFILENNIEFQNLTSSNDVFYSLSLYVCTDEIVVCEDKPLVKYRCGQKSQISANRDPRNIYLVGKKAWERFEGNRNLDISALSLFILIGMINELNRCNNDEWKKECYVEVTNFIKKYYNDISLKNELYSYYIKSLLTLEYSSGWYKDAFSFQTKLRVAFPEIERKIKDKKNLVLWGIGERGKAFLQVCKENKFEILFITDKQYDAKEKIKYDDILIINSDEALKEADGIIASNHAITEYIHDSRKEVYVCDLEDYC